MNPMKMAFSAISAQMTGTALGLASTGMDAPSILLITVGLGLITGELALRLLRGGNGSDGGSVAGSTPATIV